MRAGRDALGVPALEPLAASSSRRPKAIWLIASQLIASLVTNLGCLGFFKYTGFALENRTWPRTVRSGTGQPQSTGQARSPRS